jgi:hypothetical protein
MESARARNTEYARFFYEGLAEPLLGDSPIKTGGLERWSNGIRSEQNFAEFQVQGSKFNVGGMAVSLNFEPGTLNLGAPRRSLRFFLLDPLNRIPDKLAGIAKRHLLFDMFTIGLHRFYAQV